jgi:hypothetical protein
MMDNGRSISAHHPPVSKLSILYKPPLRSVLWAAGLVFILHDMEEALTIEGWLANHSGQLPFEVPKLFAQTTRQFSASVTVLALAFFLICYLAVRSTGPGLARWLYLLAVGTLLANAFSHAGQALFFQGYVPGLITAILLCLPYSICAFWRVSVEGWVTAKGALAATIGGLALQAPLAAIALIVGQRLAGA